MDKTKCMFFHKRRPITLLQFSMNNRAIDVVKFFYYLGIILDANMSWKSHIAMVRNKLSRINGILHRLKYLYPQNILVTIYNSLFIPHINYGSLLWGQVGESLDTIQKKATRTITYSHYIAHSEPLLKELNLLKVQDLFQLKILQVFFKLYCYLTLTSIDQTLKKLKPHTPFVHILYQFFVCLMYMRKLEWSIN